MPKVRGKQAAIVEIAVTYMRAVSRWRAKDVGQPLGFGCI